MTTTCPMACGAPAVPLTFAAEPDGRFPSALTEDHAEVTAPAGGAPMLVMHRYADLLSVKSSREWRMANRCETPLTGAEIPGGHPPGHMLGMDGPAHRKLRQTIGHLFTSDAANTLRPHMRETAAHLLDKIALWGTGDLRADYAEPATAATVCAALQIPVADWVPVIRPAGEIAFGVVWPGGGLTGAQAAWGGIWDYYRRVIAAKQASPDGGLVAQMSLAMRQAGYTTEEIVRAVATVSNGATALLPVLERVLLWLLQHPDYVAEVFLGERTWAQAVRQAVVQGALFPVTPPLVAGKGARIGQRRVPEGTLVLPSLASAVPQAGAWLAFGPGQHRCPGDELTLAALEEYAEAFFRRHPCAYLTTTSLSWRDGPLSTPREARFAVRRLPRPVRGLPERAAGQPYCRRFPAVPMAALRQRPLPAAAWYCSTTLAGMRPRSLTARPWSFAHARISPERWRLAAVRAARRGCVRPALRAWSINGASCLRNAAAFFALRSIS
jgi:cytochrome P450